ncbi:hypothetical protein [Aestuariivivens sediminis]|uniref:hypothetical protein n=1 Tax=Aestuariivivens sediminis TaxID=2913557 RepID=UPI001F5A727A|nr:hypothetical protein [Aestuariivivens sediminis]
MTSFKGFTLGLEASVNRMTVILHVIRRAVVRPCRPFKWTSPPKMNLEIIHYSYNILS